MDEEETVQRDLSETPLEAPQPKKRGRPKKEREMEQVDVTISSKGKEKHLLPVGQRGRQKSSHKSRRKSRRSEDNTITFTIRILQTVTTLFAPLCLLGNLG